MSIRCFDEIRSVIKRFELFTHIVSLQIWLCESLSLNRINREMFMIKARLLRQMVRL